MEEKRVTLRDGREAVVRSARMEDVDLLHTFYCAMPEEDRRFLRRDVTQRHIVQQRLRDIAKGRAFRLVVIVDDQVIGDGSLELGEAGWKEDIGEIRLIVARSHQQLGVGTLLARELYFIAAKHNVVRIEVRMLRPQVGAQHIMKRLGFREGFVIPDHVRDQNGEWQDLVVMRCDLEDLWDEMENLLADSDWRRHR